MSSIQYYGTGRRKKSRARVRLIPGTGKIIINGSGTLDSFFPLETLRVTVKQPLVLTETEGMYDVLCTVEGGGCSGQAGAVRLGIARALCKASEGNHREVLKRAGLLTRDSREKERKKYGLKKARKRPQYSKR